MHLGGIRVKFTQLYKTRNVATLIRAGQANVMAAAARQADLQNRCRHHIGAAANKGTLYSTLFITAEVIAKRQ